MELIEITEDNVMDFEGILGQDYVADMSRYCYRGLGALDDDGTSVGALVFELIDADSEESTKGVIRLLAGETDETKEKLLGMYAEVAAESDIAESRYETADENLARVYENAGFSKSYGESPVITLTVGDLERIPIKRGTRLPDYIKTLSDVRVVQFRNFARKMIMRNAKGSVEDLAYLALNWFDRDVSSCSVSNDKIDGSLLVRKTPSGKLAVLLYTAVGPDYVRNLGLMMVRSIDRALSLYPPDTEVVINRHNAQVRKLTDRLLAGYRGEDVYSGSRYEGR